MALKQKFFYYRDLIRFNWARSKFHYEPSGQPEDFAWSKIKHLVVLKVDGKLGDTEQLEIEAVCANIIAADGKVDLVLSTEPNYRPRDFIFNYCLKPDYIAGCDPRLKEINLFLFHPQKYDQPIALAFAAFLQRGGVEPRPIAYVPFITPESSAHIRANLELPEHDRYIGINPCGASERRRLTPPMVATITHMILAAHPESRVLLLVARSEQEYLDAVLKQLSEEEQKLVGSRIRLLPEQCSVIDYCTYIDNLRGLITIDTAAVHLACASDVPQLSFYNDDPINYGRWAPVYSCDDPIGCSQSKRFVGCLDMRQAPQDELGRGLIQSVRMDLRSRCWWRRSGLAALGTRRWWRH